MASASNKITSLLPTKKNEPDAGEKRNSPPEEDDQDGNGDVGRRSKRKRAKVISFFPFLVPKHGRLGPARKKK